MKEHMNKIHGERLDKAKMITETTTGTNESRVEKRTFREEMMCEICETVVAGRYNLNRHMRNKHKIVQESISRVPVRASGRGRESAS